MSDVTEPGVAAGHQIPVAEGLFEITDDGQVALVGSRCAACDTHYFPQALGCRNPACDATTVERVLLGRRGRLHSFTVQHYQPPALFRMNPWQPYAIGLVEIEEGLKVMAMLSDVDLESLEIDTPLRLATERLYEDEAGHDVLTYAYAPYEEGASQ